MADLQRLLPKRTARTRLRYVRVSLLALAAVGSCGKDPLQNSETIDGVMLARVHPNLLWVAERSLTATRTGADLRIVGDDFRQRAVTIELFDLPTPADSTAQRQVQLSSTSAVTVGFAQYQEGRSSYGTLPSGASGSVTITHLSSTRIAGSFSLMLLRLGPGGGAQEQGRVLTNGEFDVQIR